MAWQETGLGVQICCLESRGLEFGVLDACEPTSRVSVSASQFFPQPTS